MRTFKNLPSKYYLQHFHEFIGFIQGPCAHLLSDEDRAFIQQFFAFDEDTQCTYVRSLNRKSPLITRQSLDYQEIRGHQEHIERLLEFEFLLPVRAADFELLLSNLTKPQLIEQLQRAAFAVKQSASKQTILEQALAHLSFDDLDGSQLLRNFVLRGKQRHIDYCLFLFFGNLSSSLNKFSMRDMGIMRTKTDVNLDTARFEFVEQAKSAFFYADLRRTLRQASSQAIIKLADHYEQFPQAHGTVANRHKDSALLNLGKHLLAHQHEKALDVLAQSSEPQAQEKRIRELYKQGQKERVKAILEGIIDNPDNEEILTFAEDFLARKYQQKRTSVLTDMLREHNRVVQIDEIHLNDVEHGVKVYYQAKGAKAFHSENRLWRALFGLFFWHELFEIDSDAVVTEFDSKPKALVENCFYQRHQQAIEARLSLAVSNGAAFKLISQTILKHYGSHNGVFRWHNELMEVFKLFFQHTEIDAVTAILRAMAQDFLSLSDGFPDLMVIDESGLRFEEIKSPGDQLRKNQLLTIRQLRRAGFDVHVTQVQWFLDPNQAYSVVDIETTGGRANQHRITEIGIVKMVNNRVVDTWQTLINPQRHIPSNITRLTGIDDNMVADAPLFVEIADTLRTFLANSVFVAHNVSFDYSFIRQEFARLEQHFSMPKLCTVREMRKAVPGLPSYSLANLTSHFDIDMTRHHRALSDAKAAAELLTIINQHRHENYQAD